MAKKPGVMHRRNPFVRQETTHQYYQYHSGRFPGVENTGAVPPTPETVSYNSEAETSLRQPLGYLRVRGREEPIFTPIPGYEELFDVSNQNGAKSSLSAPLQRFGAQSTESVTKQQQPLPLSTARGTKRSRIEHDSDADDENDSEPTVSTTVTEYFNVGDIDALRAFYETRFRELTMKPMRDIVTTWVKRLEPRRQQQHGPYQRYADRRGVKPKAYTKPPWWPHSVPYVEPSHLKLQHLIPLAVTIMFIHRHNDERKRKQDPWIQKLKDDAIYLVKSKATEHFSSSKGPAYNEAMKRRALEVILPSLFNIAQSHEDYVYQEEAFEGSGKLKPGCGKLVSWQHTPRPDRTHTWKRPSKHSRMDPPLEYDAIGDTEPDDEVDDEMIDHNSFKSFKSETTEDADTYPRDNEGDSPVNTVSDCERSPTQSITLQSEMTVADPPMDETHLHALNPAIAPPTFPISSSVPLVPATIGWPYHPQLNTACFLAHHSQDPGYSTPAMMDQNAPFAPLSNMAGATQEFQQNLPMHEMLIEHFPQNPHLSASYITASHIPTHGLSSF